MTSETVLTTYGKATPQLVTLKRYFNKRIITIEFPYDVHATTLEQYFNLSDEMFYDLRSRKPVHN